MPTAGHIGKAQNGNQRQKQRGSKWRSDPVEDQPGDTGDQLPVLTPGLAQHTFDNPALTQSQHDGDSDKKVEEVHGTKIASPVSAMAHRRE